jgi:hypothetical protein
VERVLVFVLPILSSLAILAVGFLVGWVVERGLARRRRRAAALQPVMPYFGPERSERDNLAVIQFECLHPAGRRSFAFLRAAMTPEQYQSFLDRGVFSTVGSKSGLTYVFDTRHSMNIRRSDGLLFCAMPSGRLSLPLFDGLLAQKTLIELNEPAFWRVANVYRLPTSADPCLEFI